MKKNKTNRIKEFIDGKMNNQKEDIYIKQLLKQEYEDSVRQEYGEILEKEYGIAKSKAKSPSQKRLLLGLGILGLVIVLIGLYHFKYGEAKQNVESKGNSLQFAQLYLDEKKLEMTDLFRGEAGSELLETKNQAYLYYQAGKHTEANNIWSNINKTEYGTNDFLYYGISLLKVKNYALANQVLNEGLIKSKNGEEWKEELELYSILGLVLSGDEQGAKIRYEQLDNSNWAVEELKNMF